jgi:hypothetical protein
VQPDHFTQRQQQAEAEHRHCDGLPAAVIFPEPVDAPCERRTCQYRHRRNDKNEMADAIVERRPLHHRNRQRQRCSQGQHQEDCLAAGRDVAARQRPYGAGDGRG